MPIDHPYIVVEVERIPCFSALSGEKEAQFVRILSHKDLYVIVRLQTVRDRSVFKTVNERREQFLRLGMELWRNGD